MNTKIALRFRRWLPALLPVFLLVLSLVQGYRLTRQYGGTDLRCRIVGARLLAAGQDAYYHHWQPGEPEIWLDPNYSGKLPANGNVVTPAYLQLLRPLAAQPYPVIRFTWTFLQYAFLAGIFLLLYRAARQYSISQEHSQWVLGCLVLVFAATDIWYYNIDRGQTYVLYALLLFGIDRLFNCAGSRGRFWAGVAGGLFIWVRPLLLFSNLAYAATRNRLFLAGLAIGGLAGLAIFVPGHFGDWQTYAAAMREYSLEQVLAHEAHPYLQVLPQGPAIVEGSGNLVHYGNDFRLSALYTLQQYAYKVHLLLSPGLLTAGWLVIASGLCIAFYVKRIYSSAYKRTLFACFLYLLAELFLVGGRGGYNVVQWVVPAALLLYQAKGWTNLFLLVFALAQLTGWPFVFTGQGFLSEGLLLALLAQEIFWKKEELAVTRTVETA